MEPTASRAASYSTDLFDEILLDLSRVGQATNVMPVLAVMVRANRAIRASAGDPVVEALDASQLAIALDALRLAYRNLHSGLANKVGLDGLGIGIRGTAGLILQWAKPVELRFVTDEYLADLRVFSEYLDGLLEGISQIYGVWDRRGSAIFSDFKDTEVALTGQIPSRTFH